jgi:hypothetical protein
MVVRTNVPAPSAPPLKGYRAVAIIMGIALVLGVAGPFLLPGLIPASWGREYAGLSATQHAVLALPEVVAAGVQDSSTSFWGTNGSRTTRTLIIDARLKRLPGNTDAELVRIARVVLQTHAFAPGQRLMVRITYGFDLGIASGTQSFSDDEDLDTWKAKVAKAGSGAGPALRT